MAYIGGNPGYQDVAMLKGDVIISHSAADTVGIFDTVQRRVISAIKVPKPRGIATDERTGMAYVAGAGDSGIVVISSQDWKQKGSIPLKLQPGPLCISADGKLLFVGDDQDQSISVVNLAGNNEVNTQFVDGHPQALAFDRVQNRVYASLEDQKQVIVLDPDLHVLQRFMVMGSQPSALVLDSPSRRVYVAVRYAVLMLDADSGKELARVPAPAGVDSLWLDRASGKLYATSEDEIDVIRANNSSLILLDTMPLQVRSHGIAVDSTKNTIYLPAGREGRSLVLILKPIEPVPGSVDASREAMVH